MTEDGEVEESNKDEVKALVVIPREELQALVKRAASEGAREGAKVALDKYEKLMEKAKAETKDKRLHNTEMLLRNYHIFKLASENAVYNAADLEAEETANELLYTMLDKDRSVTVDGIRKSAIKTVIILKHIDTMLSLYQIYCERTNDPVQERRYEILIDRFIADPVLSVKEMAEKYHLTKKQIYSDLTYAKEKIAALIFGIDSVDITKQ